MKSLKSVSMAMAAPVLAALVAALVTTIVLLIAGDSPADFWSTMLAWPEDRIQINIINDAAVLYLSGLAAAIGFRMNLFNIGVEGQYRVATFAAAVFAGWALLPGYVNTVATILVAMLVGAFWAGIAAVLRVTRGVSEVISTIMLNAIAVSIVAYLLRRTGQQKGLTKETDTIPESGWVGGIPLYPDAPTEIYGLVFLAVAAGIAYSVVLNRTRFGFDLRATGRSQTAAVASGVNVKRMVIYSMLLSGAVAGLIGMPNLLGTSHAYGSTIQQGLGFAGIAVALLGRNHPLGIAVGALIFAYLSEQANPLGILAGISPEIIAVTQGVVVLCVVIAYEVVNRYRAKVEQREVAEALDEARSEEEVPA